MARHGMVNVDSPHPSVIVCGVKTEKELLKVKLKLDRFNVSYKHFQEPDRQNELTTLCTAPLVGEQRKLMRQYQILQDPLLKMVV